MRTSPAPKSALLLLCPFSRNQEPWPASLLVCALCMPPRLAFSSPGSGSLLNSLPPRLPHPPHLWSPGDSEQPCLLLAGPKVFPPLGVQMLSTRGRRERRDHPGLEGMEASLGP